ncbi:unnamed protein product [Didymodactylos carnosus]|uniref:Uncharacterized protein n=1 Tax=Didymodactylos carnosus TaxID=1234261 RepID=A0A8S2VKP9_9BILA|nr:unnamed protein product [Didymodactylos carnosus]CAF4389370.1 unnamed protein product [Didymodactylos carnosus]
MAEAKASSPSLSRHQIHAALNKVIDKVSGLVSSSHHVDVAKVILEKEGLKLPRHLEAAFTKVVVDREQQHLTPEQIVGLFGRTYGVNMAHGNFDDGSLDGNKCDIYINRYEAYDSPHGCTFEGEVITTTTMNNTECARNVKGEGKTPCSALLDALFNQQSDYKVTVVDSHEHKIKEPHSRLSKKVAYYVECSVQYSDGRVDVIFGVGTGTEGNDAARQAALSAATQLLNSPPTDAHPKKEAKISEDSDYL